MNFRFLNDAFSRRREASLESKGRMRRNLARSLQAVSGAKNPFPCLRQGGEGVPKEAQRITKKLVADVFNVTANA